MPERGGMSRIAHGLARAAWLASLLLLVFTTGTFAVEQGAGAAAPSAAPASRQAEHVVVIPIREEIDAVTVYSVERRMEEAVRDGASALVFELDTPGGEVGAVLEICEMIKNSPIPNTVAWINTEAYSGGAIIALACREIVIAESVSFGDAAPIAFSPLTGLQQLSPTEREKMLSPLRSELVDSARRNGYDERVIPGFIQLGVETWLVENVETGERLFVDEAEYRTIFDNDPPRSNPRVSDGATRSAPPGPADEPAPARADDDVAAQRPTLSEGDRGRYRLIEYATDGTTLLVLKSDQMKRWGFADDTVRTDEDLRAYFGAKTLDRLEESWTEKVVRFFSLFPVKALLVIVFLIATFVEMASPGLSIAGGVALAALVALLGPQLLIGAAGWWTLAAIIGGVTLVLVEVFLLPGFTIFGAGGVLLLVAGLVGSFVNAGSPRMGDQIVHGLAAVLLAFFVSGVAIYFLSKSMGTIPIFNRLILSSARADDEGAKVGMLGAMGAAKQSSPVRTGQVGRSASPLRPSGTAVFGDRLLDVVSEFGFIDEGEAVRVVSVTEYRIGVERAPEGGGAMEGSA